MEVQTHAQVNELTDTTYSDKEAMHCDLIRKRDHGSILEFGVYEGASLRILSRCIDDPTKLVHGFDSFEGLPEKWRDGFDSGAFSTQGRLPEVPNNCILHKGLFKDSVAPFLGENKEQVAYLHLDADLYSSTYDVLDSLANQNRIQRNTIIVFDEYQCYPGAEDHEMKAWKEISDKYHLKYDWIAQTTLEEGYGEHRPPSSLSDR